MRITFVLPNPIRIPMGGAKVVYRHAETLAARGHSVRVVAPRRAGHGPLAFAMRAAVAVRDRLHGVAGTQAYRARGVESLELPSPSSRHAPNGDVVIATGVQTAPWVASWPAEKGAKLYFVQGDETFVRPDARDSWHLGMPLLTVSRWIAVEMQAAGLKPLAVVPNAIDPDEFDLDTPIEGREASVLALYHRHPVKGPDVLLAAIGAIQRQRPGVPIDLFSARPPSHTVPTGVTVHVRPSPEALRALYNCSAILLHSSRSESMPLVPMEAAACGCAVVASENRGVQEYLASGESMAAAAVGDGEALAIEALALLDDPARRVQLARQARENVQAYSWSASTDALEAAIREVAQ